MKARKDLQKLTHLKNKFDDILALEQIKPEDIAQLKANELASFSQILTDRINNLKDSERDQFLKKVDLILMQCTKNQLWETNHSQITFAISTLMQEYGRMPSKSEIAVKTQLSRQTVHKHLKEYTNNPLYLNQLEQFRFMTDKVLAKVFTFAMNGDIQAAKLYLNAIGTRNHNKTTGGNTMIQNQNNYIQINGTILSQDNIKQLNPEQLNSIESILKTALQSD
jgi:hypothetical protein